MNDRQTLASIPPQLARSTVGFDLRYGNRSPKARLKFCETECGGLASCPISNRCVNWVDRGLWDKPAIERAKKMKAEQRKTRQANAPAHGPRQERP